jgi:D-alanyl-D-alanine carboxypeptidase
MQGARTAESCDVSQMRSRSLVQVLRFSLLAAVVTSLGACSAEAPADETTADGETLEGLTADDAETRAERILAQANASKRDFEPEESRTRASSGTNGTATAPVVLEPAKVRTLGLTEDTKAALGDGTWAFRFTLISGGTKTLLSEDATTKAMMGASTFKLFTGWTAFKTGSTRSATLTLMLRASKNELANLAMCQNGEKLRGYDAPCVARQTPSTSMRFRDAIPATKAHLAGEGVVLSSTHTMVDGSGLDTRDLLTIDDLTSLLDHVNVDPKRAKFLDMLAQPGVASTLSTRFPGLEGKLFAKTGTYHQDGGGVKSLAGVVDVAPGKTLIFAVVGNGVGDPSKALDRIEKVVRLHVDAANAL